MTKNARGRKPLPDAETIDVDVNEQALAEERSAVAVLGPQLREIDARLLEGRTYDRVALLDEARYFLAQAHSAFLEVGRRLIVIKEHEPFGNFLHAIEALGMNVRTAQRFMQATTKFLGPTLRRSPQLLNLGQAKLFELLAEDEGDIAAFAEGGTLYGLTLDDADRMSPSELRAHVREQRATLKAKDKVIAEKNAKIDGLSEQLHKRASSDPAERERAQLELLRADCLRVEIALLRALATVDQVMGDPATDAAAVAARQSVDFICQKLVDACLSRGITVDLAERVSPIWYQPIEQAATDGMALEERKRDARAAARSAKDDATA